MRIIPYEEKYKEDVRRICIDTASPDNKVNPEHHDFTLLMYCDEYIEHETCFLLMDEEDVPQGYIMCAEDYHRFAQNMSPYLEKIRSECPNFARRGDISMYVPYCEEYPAHLHIDIEEGYTGGGNGTRLMKTLTDYLREKQIPGIMLGVGKTNERAYSFYRKMGFQILREDAYGASMGLKL